MPSGGVEPLTFGLRDKLLTARPSLPGATSSLLSTDNYPSLLLSGVIFCLKKCVRALAFSASPSIVYTLFLWATRLLSLQPEILAKSRCMVENLSTNIEYLDFLRQKMTLGKVRANDLLKRGSMLPPNEGFSFNKRHFFYALALIYRR